MMVKNLEIEEKLSKAKITIHGLNFLTEDDIKFLRSCLEITLEHHLKAVNPIRSFRFLGEQCCVMTWLVDDTFIIELDFNDCLE